MLLERLIFEDGSDASRAGVFQQIADWARESVQGAAMVAFEHGFRMVGKGEQRVVFEVSNSSVLKVARNDNGKKDNQGESVNHLCSPGWFPKVFEESKDGSWIVVEKIPITLVSTKSDKLLDLTFEFFGMKEEDARENLGQLMNLKWMLKHAAEWKKFRADPEGFVAKNHLERQGLDATKVRAGYKWLFSHQKFVELLTALAKCGVGWRDIHANNYGFRADGHLVVFDSEKEEIEGFGAELDESRV
jgi:hypothetical protein